MKKKLLLQTAGMLALLFSACYQAGIEVPFTPSRPDKHPPNSLYEVRTALYIDITSTAAAAAVALETAGKYYINTDEGEMPYFDYIVISGGTVKPGKYSPVLALDDELTALLLQYPALLQSLRAKGIKLLLGIKGGDGATFANIKDVSQPVFSRECADVCALYELDGVEFWDDATNPDPAVYPEYGRTYNFGNRRRISESGMVEIPAKGEENADEMYEKTWKEGAKNMSNVMSYLITIFGAGNSFQGDVNLMYKYEWPILVRETGYARYLPSCPERFDFDTTLSCMTYGINCDVNGAGSASFGAFLNNKETGLSWMDGENTTALWESFMTSRDYGPVQIDLANPGSRLTEFSQHLGRSGYGTANEVEGDCEYGIIYYVNLQAHSGTQLGYLSETSREVYGTDVLYKDN